MKSELLPHVPQEENPEILKSGLFTVLTLCHIPQSNRKTNPLPSPGHTFSIRNEYSGPHVHGVSHRVLPSGLLLI
jgi:hypothetical protein